MNYLIQKKVLWHTNIESDVFRLMVVLSDFGGVNCLISHQQNGYICPATNPYLLVERIDKIFKFGMDESVCRNTIATAERICNRDKNLGRIVEVYGMFSNHEDIFN